MNMPFRLKAAASTAIAFLLCIPALSCGTRGGGIRQAGLPRVGLKDGRLVATSNGKPLTLRGVNLAFYLDVASPEKYITEQSIEDLADRGVNLVRICFHWRQVSRLPEECAWKPSGRAWLKRVVRWCADNGIYSVLDMHVPPGEEDIDPITGEFWDSPENADDLEALWNLIAGDFKNEPALLGYDIFTEPAPPESEQWWDLAKRLVKSIERIDRRHLIIIEPDMNHEELRDIGDARVLYSPHYYEPMVVSHQGEYWYGDTPARTDVTFPGEVPDELEYLSGADPTESVSEPSDEWRSVGTTATAPEGADVAMVSLFGWEGSTDAYFDDVSVTVNGEPRGVVNASMSEESEGRPGMPRAWFLTKEEASSFEANREPSEGHSEPGCLHVEGSGQWFSCGQDEGIQFDKVFIRVKPGDRVKVGAWVKAQTLSGEAGAAIDWCRETFKAWNRRTLEKDVDRAFGDWAKKHNAAIFIGEFGSMSRPGDKSSTNLVSDMMSVWNERGYAWTIWCYRGEYIPPGSGSFGFGLINCPDEVSPDEGYTWRRELSDPWQSALRQR
jgi:hypothetical protein